MATEEVRIRKALESIANDLKQTNHFLDTQTIMLSSIAASLKDWRDEEHAKTDIKEI